MHHGRFREIRSSALPNEERTPEMRRGDLVLYLLAQLSNLGFHHVNYSKLHDTWGLLLELLRKEGVEYQGFFEDSVTHRFQALHYEIVVAPKSSVNIWSTENLIRFDFVARDRRTIESTADRKEWEAIRKVLPAFIKQLSKA